MNLARSGLKIQMLSEMEIICFKETTFFIDLTRHCGDGGDLTRNCGGKYHHYIHNNISNDIFEPNCNHLVISDTMVVEDDLDYSEIPNNQTLDVAPCSCPSSSVH